MARAATMRAAGMRYRPALHRAAAGERLDVAASDIEPLEHLGGRFIELLRAADLLEAVQEVVAPRKS